MASVSSNYAEVFVDGGAAAASTQAAERVIYSEVQIGGVESVSSRSESSMAQQQRQILTSAQQQEDLQQQQHITLQQSHFTQNGASETSAAAESQMSAALIQAVAASESQMSAALESQAVAASEVQAVAASEVQAVAASEIQAVAASEIQAVAASESQAVAASEVQAVAASESWAMSEVQVTSGTYVSSQSQVASETPLSDRIVGYGYQSYAIEVSSAETQQTGDAAAAAGKKESRFGQFRRSISRGKKPRLPTGQATNFANSRDVIMKGWLHKQDSGGFHLWKRRWFVLRADEIYYYKSPKDNGALGQIKLTPEHRIVPTDENLSKRYSFKIEKAGERTYCLAADDKETLTNWMNAVSLSALGISPETITQSLQELKPAGTIRKTTSASSTMSKTISGSSVGSSNATSGRYRVQPGVLQVQSQQATVTPAATTLNVASVGGANATAVTSNVAATSSATAGFVAVNGAATSSSIATGETQVKKTKSLQSCEISEAESDDEEDDDEDDDEEEDEDDDDEEEDDDDDDDEISSKTSSGMEQVDFARLKKAELHQQQPVNGFSFGKLTENVNINQSENVNINVSENVTENVIKNVIKNVTTDEGIKSFFGAGQHITGVSQQPTTSGDTLTKPLAVKPPAYDTLKRGPVSDVGVSGAATQVVSGRAGQIYGNLADWQNRTLQRPPINAKNRSRFASAGDPLATTERRAGGGGGAPPPQADRTRTKSAERELDEPGVFQRTQSMRSLKMWYDYQRTTGKSRGGTPEPDRISPYGGQQPLIMDLDRNDKLYVNPSTTTMVRSKSRQGHQTLNKSSGALVPIKQAPRPATAMGVHGGQVIVTRDQIAMQKNYQMQMFLRQQYLAQQQQQQQQQNALLMQQQMQQQQALFLQQQIKKEEELLRRKTEKEKKEKEKRSLLKQKREQELIEEQLKRSTTIINENVIVNQGDPKVKRVFVRRAKKPKPPSPPPPPAEKKEFSCQTITDTGVQTEVEVTYVPPPPPPSTFSETLIVHPSPAPSPAPVLYVETVTISPPTPEESSEAESEEEWEVLVSSDQNSWNMVAKETLPARVIRSASLSNLEFFIKDELSAETQKVLEEAEEVRFSEEVIQTILTKTVEDTTTTNTTKTVSMVTETNDVAGGDFTIQDVEEGEIVLPAITAGPSGLITRVGADDAATAAASARTTTVTKISTEPFQDTQTTAESTEDGEGKLLTTSFHQGHATLVDDRVAYDYGSSDDAQAEFQRQLQQMQAEFGQAGDVVSDSGMSYQTPAGHQVDVQQRVSTVKSGVQVTVGGGNQQLLQQQQQQQQQRQQQQQWIQAPEISITDLETNQVLRPQDPSVSNGSAEPQLQVTTGDLGGVDISLGDFRIATIKRRVSAFPEEAPQPRLTPEREATTTKKVTPEREATAQTKTVKGILKKRPSSSSSDVSGSASQPFAEQFLDTVQKVAEGQFSEVQSSGSSTTKTTEFASSLTSVEKVSTSVADAAAIDAGATNKSTTIVLQANSPLPERKNLSPPASSSVDISLESPSTKHFSTHLHKTISSSSSPTLVVEVDPSAAKKPTTILTTTLDFNPANDSSTQYAVEGTTTSSVSQKNVYAANQVEQSSSLTAQSGRDFKSASLSPSSSSIQLQADMQHLQQQHLEQQQLQQHSQDVNAELTEIMNELKQTELRSSASAVGGVKSEISLAGAVLPPLEHDIERVRERFVQSVSQKRDVTENAGALGRRLIALKRETEAKENTMNYFARRLKEEEGALEIIRQTEAGAGGVPYMEARRKTQEANVSQLREKVGGLRQSIQEGKTKIESLEVEWSKVKPEGDVDLLASLSRSASSSREMLRGGVSTESLGAGGSVGGGGDASANGAVSGGGSVAVSGGGSVGVASGAVGGGGGARTTVISSSSSSTRIDPLESKAVAVEKEAMRSVLSTISSQFTARNQDFDHLRREEEEIKAMLASRMRGIDLEIDQIEADQQRMEIEQVLGDLHTEDGLEVVENTQQMESTT